MHKTLNFEITSTYDGSRPGLYYDANSNMLWIVNENLIVTSWGMPPDFTELLAVAKDDDTTPYVAEKNEVRGLTADDLKEMLAMQHAIAADSMVKR